MQLKHASGIYTCGVCASNKKCLLHACSNVSLLLEINILDTVLAFHNALVADASLPADIG